MVNAEELAYGRWPDILSACGIDSTFFSGKNMSCPICLDGTDRYRFQNRNGGRWLCTKCTSGHWSSMFDLLIRHMGFHSFREAADYVREHYGIKRADSPERIVQIRNALPAVPKDKPIDVEGERRKMERVLAESRAISPGDPVDLYLRKRVPTLQEIPAEIRFHPRMGYWEKSEVPGERPVLVGYFPAMIVKGIDASGQLVQVHRTFLTEDGEKAPVSNVKKTMTGVGSNSFALRLGWPQGDTLGVCEGIETALGAMALGGEVVWPCYSAGVLENFRIPQGLESQIRRVIIYADYDEVKNGKRTGTAAAAKLADSLRAQRVRSMIVRPARVGEDFADLAKAAA